MTVDHAISLALVRSEYSGVLARAPQFAWKVSDLIESSLVFDVTMNSRIDGGEYKVELRCDDYKEKPPYIEFINPKTGERGVPSAYPKDAAGDAGAIFHGQPCVCHPCSRKAYEAGGPHLNDWGPRMKDWVAMSGGLVTLLDILMMIQARINLPGSYAGRMA